VLPQPSPSHGLPDLLEQRLANRHRRRGVGLQDGGEPALEHGRDALGRSRFGRRLPPACAFLRRGQPMGRILESPARANASTNRRIAAIPPTKMTLTRGPARKSTIPQKKPTNLGREWE